jgi:hypothetical protein
MILKNDYKNLQAQSSDSMKNVPPVCNANMMMCINWVRIPANLVENSNTGVKDDGKIYDFILWAQIDTGILGLKVWLN